MRQPQPEQSTAVVTERHAARRGEILELAAGASVQVGHRDDEYPAFTWCTGPDGASGWVPETYLAREAPEFNTATLLHDYSSRELSVEPDDHLVILAEEGGWLLCRRADGEASGWVPERAVQRLG
jgi:hypothetical protein